jgi:anthranilate phosphoribosyltransferase
MALRKTLEQLLAGEDLTESEAADLLLALTESSVSPAMAGGLLIALRCKGVTPAEVRGFAGAMRGLARRPHIDRGVPLVDIVGTGGDASGSFNLSTGTALLIAAMGLRVVKHGNRSISSKSGSADLMEALGLRLPLDEAAAGACLDQTNFTFLFAPHYHPAMKAVAPIRQALGVRTVFNILGPLTNPAEPQYHLIGAFNLDTAKLMADTLSGMNLERAFVVHGEPGWDEATPVGPFTLFDVRPGSVRASVRDADVFGLPKCTADELKGGDAEFNAAHLRTVLSGQERGAHRNAIVLGAALVLELTGTITDPRAAARAAEAAIDAGKGLQLLERLAAFNAENTKVAAASQSVPRS